MTVIRWEDPPAGNIKFQPIANALRKRPGTWAVVVEDKTPGYTSNLAHRIRTGKGPFTPSGAFEARVIGPAAGCTSKVYARYVGAPPSEGGAA